MARNRTHRNDRAKSNRRTRTQGRLRKAFSSLLDSGAQALESLHGGGRGPAYAPSRVRKAPLMLESLEQRQMLASDVFVNDNWVVTADVGAPGLSAGDTVANTGFGDDGTVTGQIFGNTAFSNVADSLPPVDVGGNIHVITGSYSTPATIDKSVNLRGAKAGVSGIGRDPNATAGESFMVAAAGSFIIDIAADNVTIDGFTFRDASTSSAAVTLSAGTTGHLVQNNVFARNIYGLSVASDNTTVEQNAFFENNRSVRQPKSRRQRELRRDWRCDLIEPIRRSR